MGKFEKGNKFGNRFSSKNQPKKRGRGKLSLYDYIRKVTGEEVDPNTSKEDIIKTMRFLYESSLSKLEPLLKDPDHPKKPNPETPIWVLNFIAAMNQDLKNGKTTTIEILFDRVFGKPTQNLSGEIQTTVSGQDLFKVMTPEEIKNFENWFEQNY